VPWCNTDWCDDQGMTSQNDQRRLIDATHATSGLMPDYSELLERALTTPPTPLPSPAVKVHRPYVHGQGQAECAITVTAHTYVVTADQRFAWGRILAGLAVPEPELLTVQMSSIAALGEAADETEQAHADRYTTRELVFKAVESARTVVAIGPLKHVQVGADSGQFTPLMMWRRRALTVPLVQGWNGVDR
jgi:hypothetical protein